MFLLPNASFAKRARPVVAFRAMSDSRSSRACPSLPVSNLNVRDQDDGIPRRLVR